MQMFVINALVFVCRASIRKDMRRQTGFMSEQVSELVCNCFEAQVKIIKMNKIIRNVMGRIRGQIISQINEHLWKLFEYAHELRHTRVDH